MDLTATEVNRRKSNNFNVFAGVGSQGVILLGLKSREADGVLFQYHD